MYAVPQPNNAVCPSALPAWLATVLVTLVATGSAAQTPAPDTLTPPPVLEDPSAAPDTVEVDLVAEPTRLSVLDDVETDVWAYNGSVPGPTLELREGDYVIVRFENRLPEETTVHWHGLRLPFAADGSPFHPVAPGGEYTYAFTVPRAAPARTCTTPTRIIAPPGRSAWAFTAR